MAYINHVAIPVRDLERCTAFYVDVFEAEVIPAPLFTLPVVWLRLGDTQLHLAERPGPSEHYHFGVTVDDFEAIYWKASEGGLFDRTTFGHHIYELPGGNVQMWLVDPDGNVVECDWPDVTTLDERIRADMKRWADFHPQSEWNERSTLFLRETLAT